MKDQKLVHQTKQETIDRLNQMFMDSLNHQPLSMIEKMIDAIGSYFNMPLYLYESIQPSLTRYHIADIDLSTAQEVFKRLLNQKETTSSYLPLHVQDQMIGFIYIEAYPKDSELLQHLFKLVSYRLTEYKLSLDFNEMKKQNQALVQTKQHFLSNMSHEIKTPLSGIYSSLYLLGSTDLSLEQKEFHQLGSQSLDKLSSIIDDMLELSHIDSGKLNIYKDTFNLEEEMIRLYRILKRDADQKNIKFDFIYNYQKAFECIGDFRKIRQIIHNLVDNSIKFTNQGSIVFSIDFEETLENTLIVCSIKDTGIGISSEHLTELFDLFYQIDQEDTKTYDGVGIGLTIASKLVNALSGTIEIKSELGKGSEFIVKIPVEKGNYYDFSMTSLAKVLLINSHKTSYVSQFFESMEMKVYSEINLPEEKVDYIVFEKPEISKQKLNQLTKKYAHPHTMTILLDYDGSLKDIDFNFIFDMPISRDNIYKRLTIKKDQLQQEDIYQNLIQAYVLIVDDNRLNRVALSNTLSKLGMDSKQADSGKQAIEFVKKENFDCILMDIQMPEMDGIEAIRRIRSLGKAYESIPIIAVTANAFLKDYDVMKTAKITDVIFKPIHVDHLKQVLRKYLKPKSNLKIPADLFVFDQTDFRSRFEESYEIGNEVIKTFLLEYPKDMKRIEDAIYEKHMKNIEHEAHYFKGSCSYLSAKRLVWLLSLFVESAKKNDLKSILLAHQMLMNEMDIFIEVIKEYQL